MSITVIGTDLRDIHRILQTTNEKAWISIDNLHEVRVSDETPTIEQDQYMVCFCNREENWRKPVKTTQELLSLLKEIFRKRDAAIKRKEKTRITRIAKKDLSEKARLKEAIAELEKKLHG